MFSITYRILFRTPLPPRAISQTGRLRCARLNPHPPAAANRRTCLHAALHQKIPNEPNFHRNINILNNLIRLNEPTPTSSLILDLDSPAACRQRLFRPPRRLPPMQVPETCHRTRIDSSDTLLYPLPPKHGTIQLECRANAVGESPLFCWRRHSGQQCGKLWRQKSKRSHNAWRNPKAWRLSRSK